MTATAAAHKWHSVPLSDLCERTASTNPAFRPDEFFSYVDVSCVSNDSFKIVGVNHLQGKDAPSRARQLIEHDDVIFATVRPALRRVAMVPRELHGEVSSTGFCILRANKQQLSPHFLYFYLLSEPVRQRVEALQTGATYPAINDGDLLRMEIPLPPLPEQQAIAHILQTVQKAKEARQRELPLERERKARLMEHLFTHGTRSEATKLTEIGEIPESWSLRPLNEIADLFSGGTPSKSRPDWWKGSIPWVSTKDLKKVRLGDVTDHITEEAVREGSRLAPANSLFVGVRGMILAKEIPICLATAPMAFNQDVKAVVPREGISPDFLLYAMNFFKSALNPQVGTSAHGTKRISGDAIATLKIPIPEADEQAVIADALAASDGKFVALEQELTLLSELFNALLEELMTGRVAVRGLIDGGSNA
jgi:type I restriction enzyme, S subunit